MMGTPFCQKPFFHSKNTDVWVDAHYLLAHHSLLRRWRPCGGRPVCVGVRLSLCTTVGRYGDYLSSQHLDLDSTDQNNPPRWVPSWAFSNIAAKHKRHARCSPCFVLHLFFPSFLTTTLLSFFLLTHFSHINGTTRVYMVYYIHYKQLEIELAVSRRLFLYGIP